MFLCEANMLAKLVPAIPGITRAVPAALPYL